MKTCDICKKEVDKLVDAPKRIRKAGVNDLCEKCSTDFYDFCEKARIECDGLYKKKLDEYSKQLNV